MRYAAKTVANRDLIGELVQSRDFSGSQIRGQTLYLTETS